MNISEIRGLSDTELAGRKRDARAEYFNLRLQQQTGSLEKPSRLTELRHIVARIETVMSERRLGLKTAAPKAAAAPKTTKAAATK